MVAAVPAPPFHLKSSQGVEPRRSWTVERGVCALGPPRRAWTVRQSRRGREGLAAGRPGHSAPSRTHCVSRAGEAAGFGGTPPSRRALPASSRLLRRELAPFTASARRLGAEPVACFRPRSPLPGLQPGPGQGSGLWGQLCAPQGAPPLSFVSLRTGCPRGWEWEGGRDPKPELRPAAPSHGRAGARRVRGSSWRCCMCRPVGDVAGGVEISARGFLNFLPARHRTGRQDPGCRPSPHSLSGCLASRFLPRRCPGCRRR